MLHEFFMTHFINSTSIMNPFSFTIIDIILQIKLARSKKINDRPRKAENKESRCILGPTHVCTTPLYFNGSFVC